MILLPAGVRFADLTFPQPAGFCGGTFSFVALMEPYPSRCAHGQGTSSRSAFAVKGRYSGVFCRKSPYYFYYSINYVFNQEKLPICEGFTDFFPVYIEKNNAVTALRTSEFLIERNAARQTGANAALHAAGKM